LGFKSGPEEGGGSGTPFTKASRYNRPEILNTPFSDFRNRYSFKASCMVESVPAQKLGFSVFPSELVIFYLHSLNSFIRVHRFAESGEEQQRLMDRDALLCKLRYARAAEDGHRREVEGFPAFVRGVVPEGVAVGAFVGFADLDPFEAGGGVNELFVLGCSVVVFGAPDDLAAGGASD
jgi:hypothetical protein